MKDILKGLHVLPEGILDTNKFDLKDGITVPFYSRYKYIKGIGVDEPSEFITLSMYLNIHRAGALVTHNIWIETTIKGVCTTLLSGTVTYQQHEGSKIVSTDIQLFTLTKSLARTALSLMYSLYISTYVNPLCLKSEYRSILGFTKLATTPVKELADTQSLYTNFQNRHFCFIDNTFYKVAPSANHIDAPNTLAWVKFGALPILMQATDCGVNNYASYILVPPSQQLGLLL